MSGIMCKTMRNQITGNGQLTLEGGLYFLRTRIDFAGRSTTDVPAPLIVARDLRFVGTTSLIGNGKPSRFTELRPVFVQ